MTVKTVLTFDFQADEEREMEEKLQLPDSAQGLAIDDYGPKGRGIKATRPFKKGEFLVEYAGQLIDVETATLRDREYDRDPGSFGSYVYHFKHNGQRWCIDATEDTGRFGRLVNHSRRNPNCQTRVCRVGGQPRLILVAKKDIGEDEGMY